MTPSHAMESQRTGYAGGNPNFLPSPKRFALRRTWRWDCAVPMNPGRLALRESLP